MASDEELIQRYQHAWATRRQLRAVAKQWRRRGEVEPLAEYEIALNEGREAAYHWLLGKTPIGPASSVPLEVTGETIAAELDRAQQLAATRSPEPEGLLDSYAGRSDYARGVIEALRWHLTRPQRAS